MSIDYDKIKQLISLVERNGLTELSVEEGEFAVTIKADSPGDGVVISLPASQAAHVEAHSVEAVVVRPGAGASVAETEPPSDHLVQITSPMIGVFYRRPSPDAPSYIDIGNEIEEGQTIGLIEAMKVFSEVPSEVSGRVVAIPAENAKLVQAGDVIAVVDTSPIGHE